LSPDTLPARLRGFTREEGKGFDVMGQVLTCQIRKHDSQEYCGMDEAEVEKQGLVKECHST